MENEMDTGRISGFIVSRVSIHLQPLLGVSYNKEYIAF